MWVSSYLVWWLEQMSLSVMPPEILTMIGSWDVVAWNKWSSQYVSDGCSFESFETGEWINDTFVLGALHPRAECYLLDWFYQERWEDYESLQAYFAANEWLCYDNSPKATIFGLSDPYTNLHTIGGKHSFTVSSRKVVVKSQIRLSRNVNILVVRYGWLLDRNHNGSLQTEGDFVITRLTPRTLDFQKLSIHPLQDTDTEYSDDPDP